MAPQLPYYVLEGGRETVGRLSRYFIHMGSIRSEAPLLTGWQLAFTPRPPPHLESGNRWLPHAPIRP